MAVTPTLKDCAKYGNTGLRQVYGVKWATATFVAYATYLATSVALYFNAAVGSPGTLTYSIRATDVNHKPTGPDLAVGSVNANGWGGGYLFATLAAPFQIVLNTEYAIVGRMPSGNGSNYCYVRNQGTTGGETTNDVCYGSDSGDSGVTWETPSSNRYTFQVYGAVPPVISTGAAINLTATSTLLQGTIDTPGNYSPLYTRFDWGLNTSYGNSTAENTIDPAAPIPFSDTINGLTIGTTYHYRAVVRYI